MELGEQTNLIFLNFLSSNNCYNYFFLKKNLRVRIAIYFRFCATQCWKKYQSVYAYQFFYYEN